MCTVYTSASVNDQMDPNNISGLLKLHLRENPLLSSSLITECQEHMSSPNEIVSYQSVKTFMSRVYIYRFAFIYRLKICVI